jgi:Prealbumin-like fold domain
MRNRIFGAPGDRRRRRGVAVLVVAALVGAAVVAIPSFANLSGSNFEGNDGNLVVNTAGNHDWANAPNRVRGDDLPSGTSDNAFGQGTKEDDANVSVVTGSIPPNKSDLTRFYIGSEFASNSNFLYLAWERSNVLGSANMDFEINQKTQPDLTTKGAKTLNRTAGDILITFDFTNGGGNPVLGLLTWVTSGSTNQCFSANALPCWGNRVNLSAAGFAEGAVNSTTVTDPIANQSLAANEFGEAAVNLTAAGVFPAGTCEAFGSAFLKSRSSSSFPAEVKDFVAPQPVNISNCGEIKIIKHTDPRGVNQNFGFTSTIPNPPTGSTTPSCTSDTTPSAFTLNDNGNTTSDSTGNTEDCVNVPAGSYTVTEGANPANFTFAGLSCTASGTGTTASQDGTVAKQANITIAPSGVATCTYTNQQQLGAIRVTKTYKHAATGSGDLPQSGVSFTVNGVTKQTNSNGRACFAGLSFGSYTVHETVPAGYHVDANDKSVTVDNNASCGDSPYVGENVSFHNTPLTDITASVDSQVDGGTASTITCTDGDGNTVASGSTDTNGDGSATATDLEPGTYTCAVVVDP